MVRKPKLQGMGQWVSFGKESFLFFCFLNKHKEMESHHVPYNS